MFSANLSGIDKQGEDTQATADWPVHAFFIIALSNSKPADKVLNSGSH